MVSDTQIEGEEEGVLRTVTRGWDANNGEEECA